MSKSKTLKLRSAAGTPAKRTAAEIAAERARLVGVAELLHTRSQTQELTAEEAEQLEQALSGAEALDGELTRARQAERLAHQRSQLTNPTRPAVLPTVLPATPRGGDDGEAEAMRLWFRSFTDEHDNDPETHRRAAAAGFPIGRSAVRLDVDYGSTLNTVKRRALSKGGATKGAEYMPAKTYSAKVVEFLTFFSPLLGLVDSETTNDGNPRDYFRLDDTALMSSYITASGGTELAPTIPDNDVATGAVSIAVFDITSGYHKLTRQAVRDSAVSLQDKVTKAIGNSHARRMERDVILGTGNGSNGVQGLIQAATVHGGAAVDAYTAALFEAVYFSVPQQYRAGCIWLFSDTAMEKAVGALKDSNGNSLFGKTAADGAEIRTLHGRPCYTSEYMPAYGANAKSVLFFNPLFYMLRLVAGQTLDVLREKFHPHLAYAGEAAFGGAWVGPTSACKAIQSDATPNNGAGT